MATVPRSNHPKIKEIHYPDSDGKPMAETPVHRQDLTDLIEMLANQFADDLSVYVSGNMFLYFQEGDPKQCVAPDVFLVRGVPRDRERRSYKTWEEGGKGPDLVIELTSRKTRREDRDKKLPLYRDRLAVPEYVLFDPYGEYLKPSLQGFRLEAGNYVPIEPVDGRLPSAVLGLHLEGDGRQLRLFDPTTGRRVLLDREARREAEMARQAAEMALQAAEAENERLRRELEALRRRGT